MNTNIKIADEGDILDIGFSDVYRFHGPGSLAGAAIGFKALQTAVDALFPDVPPERGALSILSGHPGPGVRDAFEMVTRAVTRRAYVVDTARPKARWNPYKALSFSFVVNVSDGRSAEVVLEAGVVPHRFFELLELVSRPEATVAEKQELRDLKKSLAERIIAASNESLFTLGGD